MIVYVHGEPGDDHRMIRRWREPRKHFTAGTLNITQATTQRGHGL